MKRVAFAAVGLLAVLVSACSPAPQPSQTAQSAGGAVQAATAPNPQAAAPLTVAERVQTSDGTVVAKLSDGLTVIIKAVRTSPVVCVRSYVGAGSMYEREWLGCGLSHLCEHLTAEGAEHDMGAPGETATTQPARQPDKVNDIGGQSNAFTSMDHTEYYISAAATRTMDCIDVIADWMARPNISRADFEREHGVVQRELEMDLDIPERNLWESHSANVYGDHPAGIPVIGFPRPLSLLTYEEVMTYHNRMYVPQNMVFVIVGDIDVKACLDHTCKSFAGFAEGRSVDLGLPDVRPIAGVRRVIRPHKSLKDTMEAMSFITIPLIHEDLYALDVLASILGDGEASRLALKIEREKKLVLSISCGSYTPAWGRGEFEISFRCDSSKADAAERAVLDELKTVLDKGVTDEELARAKRQKVAELVYAQQSAESIAEQLAADYMGTGDVTFSKDYTHKIQAVTAEQVKKAARKYFTFDSMAITRLAPAAAVKTAASGPAGAEKAAAATAFTLPNGLKVVLSPNDSVGLVAMCLDTRGGLLLETEKTNGTGSMMMAMTTKGAGKMSADEIAEFFDDAGGSVAGSCMFNSFLWQASVLDDSFTKALPVFADVVLRPRYDANELEILRRQAIGAIDHVDEEWQSQIQKFFREKFFTNSPYGLLPSGKKDVVSAVTAKQLDEYHKANIVAGSSVLTVYGHFNPEQTRRDIAKLFAAMPAGKVKLPAVAPREVKQPEMHILPTNNTVSAIVVAMPNMTVTNEDRYALNVLDTIISGWELPSGWLHNELRGKQLVYVVHAYSVMGEAPGAFLAYAACQPEKAPEVIRIINKNLQKASTYTPSQAEINEAINTILTAELLNNQTMPELAMGAAVNEMYGFGYDFNRKLEGKYRKVTPADVLRVAKKYLSGPYVTIVTTPKPELLEGKPVQKK